MAPHTNDTSGIRFPPPLIYAALFGVGYAVHRVAPLRLWPVPGTAPRVIAWCLVAAWVLLTGVAVFLFRRAGTTPNPTKPTTALVLRGPYRFTRNPMYLGFAALYLLWTVVSRLWKRGPLREALAPALRAGAVAVLTVAALSPWLVNLSRNFGQAGALFAGFNNARGDAVICISADLQDPISLMANMVACWKHGTEIVVLPVQKPVTPEAATAKAPVGN